jgi:hypothetical protein
MCFVLLVNDWGEMPTEGTGKSCTRALERAKSAFISMNGAGERRVNTAATPARKKPAGRSEQFAEYSEAGEDQNDQRPGHGTVQKSPHGSPQFIATIPGCPSRPNGQDRLALFLEYRGDALNQLRIGVPDVVARQLWRNSRFARAMVMAMR